MLEVDRGDYCINNKARNIKPYQDSPQTIGYGVTISAPVNLIK